MAATAKQNKHDIAKLAFIRDAVLSDDHFNHEAEVDPDLQEAVQWICERSALQVGAWLCCCARVCFLMSLLSG